MTARRTIDPATVRSTYPILGALVSPRPIAWVSTTSADGVDNLAPHSFCTLVSTEPPIILVSSIGEKDTLRNARETGEFVVAGAPWARRDAVNLTGVDFGPEVSEFDEAGLTREPSERVRAPRVAESPFALECRLIDTIEAGNGTMILGEVILIAVDEACMDGARVHARDLGLAARHGGTEWSAVGEVASLPRIGIEDVREGRA